MAEIISGDYLLLLDLQRRLNSYQLDRLGLKNLETLRSEVDMKLRRMEYDSKQRKEQPVGKNEQD